MAFYVYRDGAMIKVMQGDATAALELHERGCELGPHPFDTRDEAESENLRGDNG